MRGIILAGGSGTRLHPATAVSSKQLLPVYDKPMIYYPLSVLMLAAVREILVISTPEHLGSYRRLLGDGGRIGLSISYVAQDRPRGVADALPVSRDFVDEEPIALILGDNVFHGDALAAMLLRERNRLDGCTLFSYPVSDPRAYGVATMNAAGRITSLEEKPVRPRSRRAVTGLYLYSNEAVEMASRLTPSSRGELEIADLNRMFVAQGRARLVELGPHGAWFDTGTSDGLLDAALFVRLVAKREGMRIGCIEEVAYRMGFIGADRLTTLGEEFAVTSEYGRYLTKVAGTAATPAPHLAAPDPGGVPAPESPR